KQYSASDDGRSAVLRIDRRTGTLRHRYELSDGRPHAFGDMTVARNGTAYIADGLGGGVYRIRPGRPNTLEPVVKPGTLRSPQTPAISPHGSILLVPDYSQGIARVSLAGGQLTWLKHPPELELRGIDGFYWRGRTLIAIQNGTSPERLLEMSLDDSGTRISRWQPLLAGAPGLGDATHGVLHGDCFDFIANSGWDRFGDDGKALPDSVATPAQIWRVAVAADKAAGRPPHGASEGCAGTGARH
ncbi:MAG TPA: hypothetical protein VMT29_09810, partial [Steroidobacteraceae bacterium]|nr:hypothetical protein [Steroidobacteraceae bacterium]